MKIENTVALITGANRGLGLAFAKALLDRGARKVYAGARDPSKVTLPGVVPVRLDVTRLEEVEAVAREAGDVTLVINNAGITKHVDLLAEGAPKVVRDIFEANFLGPLTMSRAFAPVLARNGGGAIINVLSALSWVVLPGTGPYSASKAAAWSMTNGLRKELQEQKTQVLALHAGYIDTDMARNASGPKVKPEDVVRTTLEALEAGEDEVLADDFSKRVKQGLSAERGVYLG